MSDKLLERADEIVASTLAWCNKKREEFEKGDPLDDLPLGRRDDPFTCPCGKATGLYVGRTEYCPTNGDGLGVAPGTVRRSLPRVVQEFVQLFDSGDLPEYEDLS